VDDFRVRSTKAGQDYLSISAKTGSNDCLAWITLYGSSIEGIYAWLRPEGEVYVEGWIKLHIRPDGQPLLRIDADLVQPIGEIDLRKKAPAKKSSAGAQEAVTATSDTQNVTDVTHVTPVTATQGRENVTRVTPVTPHPPDNRDSKKYDRPFDDEIPF